MKLKVLTAQLISSLILISLSGWVGCANIPAVKTDAYAPLKSELTFEEDFPRVWKAIEAALSQARITRVHPKELNLKELRQATERTIETDWIFSQSKRKYQEYEVNGFPRKNYLQNRFRYQVIATRVMGGVKVTIQTQEEVERLDANGNTAGYREEGDADSSLASDLIEKIKGKLLSLPAL